jgi:hypothetical protein
MERRKPIERCSPITIGEDSSKVLDNMHGYTYS